MEVLMICFTGYFTRGPAAAVETSPLFVVHKQNSQWKVSDMKDYRAAQIMPAIARLVRSTDGFHRRMRALASPNGFFGTQT